MKKIIVLLALALPLMYGCDKRDDILEPKKTKIEFRAEITGDYDMAYYAFGMEKDNKFYHCINGHMGALKVITGQCEFSKGDVVYAGITLFEEGMNVTDHIKVSIKNLDTNMIVAESDQLNSNGELVKYIIP